AEHPRPALRGGLARRRRLLAEVRLDHPAAARPHHRAGAGAAAAGLPQGLRPDLPDDRRRPGRHQPPRPAVHLRGRLHRLPPRLRRGDLLHLLLPDHRDLHRVHGHLVPTEREGMSAANPTASGLTVAAPAAKASTLTLTSGRRRRPTPARILAFVILAVL